MTWIHTAVRSVRHLVCLGGDPAADLSHKEIFGSGSSDGAAGRLYHPIGLEVELYTPLFVASWVSGWAAHVIAQHANNRLMWPRARYVGVEPRQYVPLDSHA